MKARIFEAKKAEEIASHDFEYYTIGFFEIDL
jgi:hypothetical protein